MVFFSPQNSPRDPRDLATFRGHKEVKNPIIKERLTVPNDGIDGIAFETVGRETLAHK